ncbi:MAG: ATP-binding cassette domain-containing protein, partial [Eubacterium sp.]|nr:ATP-binding cassette domain-containing protein [Eubacterium sp.]
MISVRNIEKSYGTKEAPVKVLKGVSFDIQNKDFVVILGASGSGKSTLLNVISGLERADNGSVVYDDSDIAKFTDSELT